MTHVLPITEYREQILDAVEHNQVVIIKAETGSGKSTQVPQFLLKHFQRVIVTEPRRIAAKSLAQRIAQEMQCEVGGLVGYRTSLERKEGAETCILMCTDGLELVQTLLGKRSEGEVLVIDELHEWNMNIELLVAWARHQLARGELGKLVLMSATIDQSSLSDYFGDAAVIEIPGRTFPVVEQPQGKGVLHDAVTLLALGHNVLVFQPGKSDIYRMVSALKGRSVDAEVFPLHGEMSVVDQLPCFLSYQRPKCIVATNVAQTSITIPDIDAVVDSGLERRTEYSDGIDGLYIRPISLTDREQRKGRAGRTKPGIYIDGCPAERDSRALFSEPAIMRDSLERVILQLALAGVDIEDVRFYHHPPPGHIKQARKVLNALGCFDEHNTLTELGERIAKLPVSPRFGRMLIEGERRGVLADVITLVSVMEQGGITNGKEQTWRKEASISSWSDAFVQLAAYEAASSLDMDVMEDRGISAHAFSEARDMRHRLYATRSWTAGERSSGCAKDITAAIYSGLPDLLYKKSLVGGYKDDKGNIRDLPEGSVVGDSEWILGLPWNLQVYTKFGPKTMRVITMATRVDPTLLEDVLPHLVKKVEEDNPTGEDFRIRVTSTYFSGKLLQRERRVV